MFKPEQVGLNVRTMSTACWRGFYCTYSVENGELNLIKLTVGLSESDGSLAERAEGPVYFGTKPQRDRYDYVDAMTGEDGSDWGDWYFAGFLHPVCFTGGLLLADGFIREMYVHMGFHPAYKYREVHELIFDRGRLQSSVDRSEQMKEFREMVADKPQSPLDPKDRRSIEGWIERAFSRDYKL